MTQKTFLRNGKPLETMGRKATGLIYRMAAELPKGKVFIITNQIIFKLRGDISR